MRSHRSAAVVAVACVAQFIVVLDVSVLNVALPSLQGDLGVSQVAAQWVVNAYALVFAGFLLVGGRLADLYGCRRVLVAGSTLFAAGGLLGGLATEIGPLVAGRAVQGLAAAALAPASLTVLTVTFPDGPRRTRAIAAWTAVGLAGGAAGNLLGGAVTQYLSWRGVLLMTVALGVPTGVLASRIPPDGRAAGRRLDLPGAAAGTVGLLALVHGITAAAPGWIGTGIAALLVFMAVERRVQDPLVPLGLFDDRATSVGNLVTVLVGACLVPMWFFLAYVMQDGIGLGPLATGLGFLPHTLVTLAVGLWAAPWLMRRIEARLLVAAGAAVAAVGFGWQSLVDGGDSYLSGMVGPAVAMSVGAGLLTTPLTAVVVRAAAPDTAGAVSGLLNTAKQVGAGLGLALLVGLAGGAPDAVTGYGRAFGAMAVVLAVAAALALGLPAVSRASGPSPE